MSTQILAAALPTILGINEIQKDSNEQKTEKEAPKAFNRDQLKSLNSNVIASTKPNEIQTESSPDTDMTGMTKWQATQTVIGHLTQTAATGSATAGLGSVVYQAVRHHKIQWKEVAAQAAGAGVAIPTIAIMRDIWDTTRNNHRI